MKQIIQTDLKKCVDCNRCARECPIETANRISLDDKGCIHVDIDHSQCIACGHCLEVCEHEARSFLDDTDRFFDDLEKGVPLSLIVAPAFKSNFGNWKNVLAWLREKGVRKIYDVSLGADICIWAYLKYLDEARPKSLITQPCPAIVSYCEIHRHDLLKWLSPVHSPMACAAVYMTKYEGVTDHIAAISPCVAKTREFEAIGTIGYNVTFARLLEYISKNNITLPEYETGFDHDESGLGTLFPMPGGLKENIEFYRGMAVRIDKAEGANVYKILNQYAEVPEDILPDIFDVLNCAEGCNMGPAGISGVNAFELHAAMDTAKKAALSRRNEAFFEDMHRKYDEMFRLSDFLRNYRPVPQKKRSVTDLDIQRAFEQLDKKNFTQQNMNCGACGANTCHDMARRVALGLNVPVNCIYKSRDDAKEEHRKNALYINLVRQLGENLISYMENEYSDSVINSLRDIAGTFNCGLASLWRVEGTDGDYRAARLFDSSREDEPDTFRVRQAWPQPWLRQLAAGEHLLLNREVDTAAFFPERGSMLIAVPIMIKGEFWGFVGMAADSARKFNEEEISAIAAGGLLIVSAIHGKQLEESAYVDSLTGIYNRRYFTEFATTQFDKQKRTKGACCAMMLDLDYFKQVNDTYGHAVGDEVLKLTAMKMRESLRSYDLFARYGGEEFVIFLSDIDERFALDFAERIRKNIEHASRGGGWNGIPVTVSIGVAMNRNVAALQELLRNADMALYAAKRNGRNQTCMYNESDPFFSRNNAFPGVRGMEDEKKRS